MDDKYEVINPPANCPPPPDAPSSLASAAPPAAPAPPPAAAAAPGAANQDTSGSTYLQSKAKTDLKSGPLAEGEGMKEAQDFGDGQSNYTNMAMPSATKSEIATGEKTERKRNVCCLVTVGIIFLVFLIIAIAGVVAVVLKLDSPF